VQLKNATVDVMNIIVTITVGVKCAQNASKCTILKEKIKKNVLGRGTAPFLDVPPPLRKGKPLPVGASIRVPLAIKPPNHISGYGTGLGFTSPWEGEV